MTKAPFTYTPRSTDLPARGIVSFNEFGWTWRCFRCDRLFPAESLLSAEKIGPTHTSSCRGLDTFADKTGWVVECGPCGQAWLRDSKRRADRLRKMHQRMHF